MEKLHKPQPAYEPNKVQAYNNERGRWTDTGDDILDLPNGCRKYIPMEMCTIVWNPNKNCASIGTKRADPGRATRTEC